MNYESQSHEAGVRLQDSLYSDEADTLIDPVAVHDQSQPVWYIQCTIVSAVVPLALVIIIPDEHKHVGLQ